MAGYNRYGYQYETSPRKLEPDYRSTQKKYPKKSTAKKTTTIVKDKRQTLDIRYKAIFYVVIGFAILFAISYRNAVIAEKYSEIKEMKSSLAAIEKENQQIEVNIESKTNLGTIEETAKEKLGMKKLNEHQTIYVNLDKQDYVESSLEDVIIEEETNIFQKIINIVKDLF